MQKFNKQSLICSDDDAVVAYLYGELSPADRDVFEDHLLVCVPCTDEFAAAADSRYSVFEWKKLEFDPLETPVFAIPYVEAKPSYSWVETLKGLFATGPRLATAGAFGLIIAVVGLAFFVGSYRTPELAAVPVVPAPQLNEATIPETVNVAAEPPNLVRDSVDTKTPGIEPSLAVVKDRTSQKARRAVKTTARKPTVASRAMPPRTESVQVPRLNEFDDISDESLRLADLVADIGSLDD